MVPPASATDVFEQHRPHLLSVAYRFLGSLTEAKDIVQESYLRWIRSDLREIRDARAFLTRIAARLCLDHLKSARVQREHYVGQWLPEPVVESAVGPAPSVELADDISVALLLALERLSPLERAAFVLHDIFGQGFPEIAVILETSPVSCRQLAARARRHVRAARPRYAISPAEGRTLVEAFEAAARTGDLLGLTRLLARDAVLHSDSGGKVRSARRRILGAERIARLFAGLTRKHGPPMSAAPAVINGLPGLLWRDATGLLQTVAFEISGRRIQTLYVVRNPDKLRHLTEPGQPE